MRKSVFFLATVLFVFPTSLLADIYGTDANGRPVILRDNGTWSYHSNPDENRCRQYAAVAVKQYGLNLSRKCGFAGRLWNANSGYHYNWCVSVRVADTQKGFRDRDNALKRCPTGGGGNAANENRCRQYANVAVKQYGLNLSRRCGFAGRLWNANTNYHYNWCMSVRVADTQQGFRDRDNALKRCPASGGNVNIQQPVNPGSMGLGSVWSVKAEGHIGTWKRRGGSNLFDAIWDRYTRRVTTLVEVNIQGKRVTAQRKQSSDGYLCSYVGNLSADGRSVSGTYTCPTYSNRQYRWSASIR
ncbi:MAG: hypothetical protein HQ513_14905 [Rhodospirillales bacterium]|nr:hypothetical protein [Rhodospirillales bacterium]